MVDDDFLCFFVHWFLLAHGGFNFGGEEVVI